MVKIKNIIKIYGDADKISEVKRRLKSKLNKVDFNKIIPMRKDIDDLPMDDYVCTCLNLYLGYVVRDKKDKYIKAFNFVGHTREIPYNFRAMDDKEYHEILETTERHILIKMLTYARDYVEKIDSKFIFNGYLERIYLWDTGCGATDVKVGESTIRFTTYYSVPVKVIKKIASMYPELKFEYTFECNGKENLIILHGKDVEVKVKNEFEDRFGFNLIMKNASIK